MSSDPFQEYSTSFKTRERHLTYLYHIDSVQGEIRASHSNKKEVRTYSFMWEYNDGAPKISDLRVVKDDYEIKDISGLKEDARSDVRKVINTACFNFRRQKLQEQNALRLAFKAADKEMFLVARRQTMMEETLRIQPEPTIKAWYMPHRLFLLSEHSGRSWLSMIALPRDDIELAKIVAQCEYTGLGCYGLATECARAGFTKAEINRIISLGKRDMDEEAFAFAHGIAEKRGVKLEV